MTKPRTAVSIATASELRGELFGSFRIIPSLPGVLRDPDSVLFSRYNVFARNFYLVCPDSNVKIYQLVRISQACICLELSCSRL